jgi:uncharacterized protein (DUF2141 family)
MAYSTSSNTAGDFPSIKMTGRKPCDPLGQMTMAETTIIAGASSKTSDTRWGDYHHMAIDDFDGETFYYTGVYRDANSTRSRVAAIKMNPDVNDASVASAYVVNPATLCGATTQLGVIIQNMGTAPITSGTFTWQVGNGAPTSVSYNSNQLNALNSTDTIFVTVSGLVSGNNTVLISASGVNGISPDENACNDAFTMTLTIGGNLLNVAYAINNTPSCTGSNGQITLTATGGTGPYTYSINGGAAQGNGVFSNLPAGVINYTVNDANACAGQGTFTLNPPVNITATATPTQILCNGQSNGSIQLSASGGQAAYTYSQNGVTYQASNAFTGLSAGTYTLYAKDANGCVGTVSATITEPSAISLNAVPTAITCFGETNGSVIATATGGTGALSYNINGGAFGNATTFSNLSAGTYTVGVQDANGCVQTFQTTVVEPTQIVASAVATPSTGANGTVTASATGGNMPYTYSINGINFYSGVLFSNLAPGTYTVSVKDVNGCIGTVQVTVEETQGLEDEDGFEVSLLYPNPNQGVFELEIQGVIGDVVDCKLFTTDGKLVSSFQLGAVNGVAKNTIEMSHKLAAGSYFIGVYNQQRAEIIRFVRE